MSKVGYVFIIQSEAIEALNFAIGVAEAEGQVPEQGESDWPAWKDFLEQLDKAVAGKKKAG